MISMIKPIIKKKPVWVRPNSQNTETAVNIEYRTFKKMLDHRDNILMLFQQTGFICSHMQSIFYHFK